MRSYWESTTRYHLDHLDLLRQSRTRRTRRRPRVLHQLMRSHRHQFMHLPLVLLPRDYTGSRMSLDCFVGSSMIRGRAYRAWWMSSADWDLGLWIG